MERTQNLKLLLEVRETIPVLDYISLHPKSSPSKAIDDMGIGLKTWYRAVRKLEDLGLVAGVRPLGGTKVRYFALTREGNEAMTALAAISILVAPSKGSLRAELGKANKDRDSERVGEILCQLLLHAEREADGGELLGLIATAKTFRRPIEEKVGAALLSFIRGDPHTALVRVEEGLTAAASSPPNRSYFKLLQLKAASLELCGDAVSSAKGWHKLRKEAKTAGDLAMVVDAHVGLGILLARGDHVPDAIDEFNKGLKVARQARNNVKEAKVLSNLAMAEFLANPDAGTARSQEAMAAALSSGALLTLAWVRGNRALMFAVKGDRSIALRELKEARRLFEKMGNERGMAAFEDWADLVKQTLSRRRYENPSEWRDLVLRSIRLRPSPKPAEPQETPSDPSQSGSGSGPGGTETSE